MTQAQIAEAYPGAAGLAWWFEEDMDDVWECERLATSGPAETVARFKKMIRQTLAEPVIGELRQLAPQVDHPDFLRYVAGKLGAC